MVVVVVVVVRVRVRVLTQHLLRTFQLAIFKKAMGENPESADLLFGYLNTSAQILEYAAHVLSCPRLKTQRCGVVCVVSCGVVSCGVVSCGVWSCAAVDKTEERK